MDDLLPFILFDPLLSDALTLVDAIVQSDSISVIPETVEFTGAAGQSSLYDGSLEELGIGAGILLTSGNGSPPLTNTQSSFTQAQLGNTDPELQEVANTAFAGAGQVLDVNTLEFSFEVDDPTVNSIAFNLVFGSDEFPEFSDSSFVDIAAVFVNGSNVALFNGDVNQPLSIIDTNLELGNFVDNGQDLFAPDLGPSPLPIEYDGVSSVLTVFASVQQGENTIDFGIADTGDQSLDSGLFIANLTTSTLDVPTGAGGGILIDILGTDEDDNLVSPDLDASLNEFFSSGAGNDFINPGAGSDTVDAGSGDDVIIGDGQSTDSNPIDGGEGIDTVVFSGNFADFGVTTTVDTVASLTIVEVGTPNEPVPEVDLGSVLYSGSFPTSVTRAVTDEDNLINIETFDLGTVSDTLVNVELLEFDDTTIAVDDLPNGAIATTALTATASLPEPVEIGSSNAISAEAFENGREDDRVLTVGGVVFGSSGDDLLYGNAGDRRLYGRDGNDTFYVGSGDRYLGGAGNDVFLATEEGGNILSGGEGADGFIFSGVSTEANTITDFEPGVDTLTFTEIAPEDTIATGDTIFSTDGNAIAIVLGIEAADFLAEISFA